MLLAACQPEPAIKTTYVSYQVNPQQQQLRLYWHNAQGQRFGSLGRLRQTLAAQGDSLVFAMNGGMFNPAFAPQGLYIENEKTVTPLDTATGQGNFYLKPNGVFYLATDHSAHIVPTAAYHHNGRVAYATQSGPMLVMDGRIHPAFRAGSTNVQIRNGVGILPNGHVLLAMSKVKVSLYHFADYFRSVGCRQALYLDGFVSRTYAPAVGWTQLDGDFGVIIGITTPKSSPLRTGLSLPATRRRRLWP
ncbi:phosphodiester glycosidase family protein [Hymenobacter sp. BT523]|uniref:phosphodiester glycosidase family protein n=1 Tax=Hymenobacter sp. BT523 TaxID=2795725 RepID=UPI0018ED74F8|nr:phosphodiester glycosidase family protein [Hymenobacter sp. BT523]MBJ6111374.1 phosphodiester glycosidase family protein [Hymenobacter sp. BT523]